MTFSQRLQTGLKTRDVRTSVVRVDLEVFEKPHLGLSGRVAQYRVLLPDVKPPFVNLEDPEVCYIPHQCDVPYVGLAGVVVHLLLQLVDEVKGLDGVRPSFTPPQPRNDCAIRASRP